LHFNAEQQQVRKLGDVDWTDATLPEEARPVVLEVLVKYAVADVMRKKILHLDGSAKAERDLRVDAGAWRRSEFGQHNGEQENGRDAPNERIRLVVNGIRLETERGLLR
jgi:hypothetical protein